MDNTDVSKRSCIAANVRAAAARKNLSPSKLAAQIGMTASTMSRRLDLTYPFTTDELGAIADATGVKIVELVAGVSAPVQAAS